MPPVHRTLRGAAMNTDRRQFLKSLSLAGIGCLSPAVASSASTGATAAPDAMGVLVDITYCVGCRKCEWACERENLGSEREIESYRNAAEISDKMRPDADSYTVVNGWYHEGHPADEHVDFVKVQCMHCIDPACASACIVGALIKEDRGPVSYDASKCIGCRYCMVACPFQIPAYEYDKPLTPRVMKCTLCHERTMTKGERPACVELCPEGCLIFGRRDELLAYARDRIEKRPERYHPHIYGEHEVGGTSWLYISDRSLLGLGMPDLESTPPGHYTERVQHGIFKNFVPPLALYGFLGALMWMNRGEEADDE